MRHKLLFFLMLLLAYGCSEQRLDVPEVKPEVVIIFSDAPDQFRGPKSVLDPASWSGVASEGTVEYIDTLFNLTGYTPKVVGLDTLFIPTFDGVAELMHVYAGGASRNYYLLNAGDTVMFTYDTITRRPYLHSLISDENTALYNVEQTTPGAYLSNGFKHYSLLYNMDYSLANSYMHGSAKFLEADGRDSIARRIYIDFDTVINDYYRFARLLSNRLDSLNKTEPRFAKFYSDNLIADHDAMRAYDKNYQTRVKQYYKTGTRAQSSEPVIDNSPKDKFLNNLSDTLLSSIRYRSKLNFIPSITYTPDLKAEYTRIDTSSNIPPLTKRKMLATVYKTMQEGFFEYKSLPANELAKYAVLQGDTITTNQLENNNKLAVEKCDLIVEDWNGKQTNFLDVIKKYKGKKIYLDYWASWCAPCKNQMPASKKLKEANKEIVFLYVAVFDEKEQWRKGVTELGLDTADCYFATNSKSSNYLTSLGVELIPRYMLFAADGSLLSKDAKRPSQNPKF